MCKACFNTHILVEPTHSSIFPRATFISLRNCPCNGGQAPTYAHTVPWQKITVPNFQKDDFQMKDLKMMEDYLKDVQLDNKIDWIKLQDKKYDDYFLKEYLEIEKNSINDTYIKYDFNQQKINKYGEIENHYNKLMEAELKNKMYSKEPLVIEEKGYWPKDWSQENKTEKVYSINWDKWLKKND